MTETLKPIDRRKLQAHSPASMPSKAKKSIAKKSEGEKISGLLARTISQVENLIRSIELRKEPVTAVELREVQEQLEWAAKHAPPEVTHTPVSDELIDRIVAFDRKRGGPGLTITDADSSATLN